MDRIEYKNNKKDLKETLIKNFNDINNHKIDNNYYYDSLWDFMLYNSNIKLIFNLVETLSKFK